MKNRIIIELRIMIIMGVLLALLALIGKFASSAVGVKMVSGAPCIYEVIDDLNGNGRYDSGETTLTLKDLQIQVDDPLGSNSGTFAASDCYLTPTTSARSAHLHLILPPAYKATSPLDVTVNMFESTHFSDYPPHEFLLSSLRNLNDLPG